VFATARELGSVAAACRLQGIHRSTNEVVREAAVQCELLGCSFYDALAPALAVLLGATLVSADARAHSRFPGVRLIG
jgi:predicted nucleic acid-binding protein